MFPRLPIFRDGAYALTGFGLGSYTVTPSKTTGQNSITSFDAAKVAQHAAGINLLTANQLIAADVSANGTVTSFDAGYIGKYAVATPPYGITGTWKFIPVNRTYPSVTSTLTGQDYTAFLMGDVSGNWANSPARPSENELTAADNSDGPVRPIEVALPNVVTAVGDKLVLPVRIDGAADKGIISYEFDLRYDPSVIQPLSDPIDITETVSRSLMTVVNANEPGLLRVVVYGPMPIDENGVLLNLRFTAVGDIRVGFTTELGTHNVQRRLAPDNSKQWSDRTVLIRMRYGFPALFAEWLGLSVQLPQDLRLRRLRSRPHFA